MGSYRTGVPNMAGQEHDGGPRTRSELQEALEQLLLEARANGVEVEGGWEAGDEDAAFVLDVHITRVRTGKQVR